MATLLQAPGLANLQRQVSSPSNTGPAPAVTTATGTGKTTSPTPANVGSAPNSAPQAAPVKKPTAASEGSLRYYMDQNGGDRNAAMKSMVDFRNNKNSSNLKPADPNLEEGTYEWYRSRGIDDTQSKSLADDYKIKMSNTTHWSEDPSVTGTEDFANQINDMLTDQEKK